MKKLNTVRGRGSKIFNEHKLTIGLDLGDRSSYYCVLDEAGDEVADKSQIERKQLSGSAHVLPQLGDSGPPPVC